MRASGILLPVASLPSRYGIGCFSKEAYEFVDRLEEAGQSYWQILPLGPTGYGDSLPLLIFVHLFLVIALMGIGGILCENQISVHQRIDHSHNASNDDYYGNKAMQQTLKKIFCHILSFLNTI